MQNQKSSILKLNFKIGERKAVYPHEIQLHEYKDGKISLYYMYLHPNKVNSRIMVYVIYGIYNNSGILLKDVSGINEYSFSDTKRAIGFFLKKKNEKIKKGYTEVNIDLMLRRSIAINTPVIVITN